MIRKKLVSLAQISFNFFMHDSLSTNVEFAFLAASAAAVVDGAVVYRLFATAVRDVRFCNL